ncbi:MAG: general secretion pathway protein GspB [Chromatiaceae bacterium]|jgi:general secretion pathway protein B
MSYILEALKKSQQDRELGQVPTLDGNFPPNEAQSVRAAPWGIAAVTLAALAVVIALYAALRGQPLGPPPAHRPPAEARSQGLDKGKSSPDSGSARGSKEGSAELQASVKAPATAPPGGLAAGAQAASASPPAAPEPAATRPSDPAALVPEPAVPPVPGDIRADIEAFKKQVLQSQAGGRRAKATRSPAPPKPVKPQDLRLPPDIMESLPPFFMTVHVYDKDPAKRFVAINSMETHEGEQTREGITVDKILPEGAVLSFEGHKFFRHR